MRTAPCSKLLCSKLSLKSVPLICASPVATFSKSRQSPKKGIQLKGLQGEAIISWLKLTGLYFTTESPSLFLRLSVSICLLSPERSLGGSDVTERVTCWTPLLHFPEGWGHSATSPRHNVVTLMLLPNHWAARAAHPPPLPSASDWP